MPQLHKPTSSRARRSLYPDIALLRLPSWSFEQRTDGTSGGGAQSHSTLFPNDRPKTEELTGAGAQVDEEARSEAAEADPNVVTWSGPDDPANPLNWSPKRKWTATILVSCFTFISPFASTMVTPVLPDIGDQYGIPEGFSRALVLSIFLLGYAQGPFVLAPLSEMFGRVRVLQYANLIFLAFNTACPFAKTATQLYAFRFLSGIGGSAPQALCSGVLADCWAKEERGKGQAIYGTLTFVAPTVAPIVGAYLSESGLRWGWVFWVTSIFDVLVQAGACLFLRESYAPRILGDRAARLREETGNPALRTEFDCPDRSWGGIARRRLALPFIMMFRHPAVQAPSIYRAFLYGIMYLVLSTFEEIWRDKYDQDKGIASLNYLSLGAGFIIGLQFSHPVMDKLYAHLKQKHQTDEGLPEWRIPPMLIGGIIAPAGMLLYGWSAEKHLHWAVPNAGCLALAAGLVVAFQSAQAYVTDAYAARHAASAAAAGALARTAAGFGFPLFAPALYGALGLGWGNTLLALVALALALPAPAALWFWGPRMRAASTAGLD